MAVGGRDARPTPARGAAARRARGRRRWRPRRGSRCRRGRTRRGTCRPGRVPSAQLTCRSKPLLQAPELAVAGPGPRAASPPDSDDQPSPPDRARCTATGTRNSLISCSKWRSASAVHRDHDSRRPLPEQRQVRARPDRPRDRPRRPPAAGRSRSSPPAPPPARPPRSRAPSEQPRADRGAQASCTARSDRRSSGASRPAILRWRSHRYSDPAQAHRLRPEQRDPVARRREPLGAPAPPRRRGDPPCRSPASGRIA